MTSTSTPAVGESDPTLADAAEHPLADGVHRPLDPRYIRVQRLTRWIATAVLAGPTLPLVVTTFFLLDRVPTWLPWLLFVGWWLWLSLLVWWAQVWPSVAYRHASYAVNADGLEIRRGVLFRAIINVPRSRVQHIDVTQGPIERSHELGTLVVYTAGAHFASVNLPGLTHARALRLRDHLLPTGSDDAV